MMHSAVSASFKYLRKLLQYNVYDNNDNNH